MKETENKNADQVQNVRQQEKESKEILFGSISSNPNLTLWEINRITLEVKKAQYEVMPVNFN